MRFVVGGQTEKEAIAESIRQLAGDKATSITVMNDIEAAMAIKNDEADYYLGACNTGGGGALAMAIALIGLDQCATLGMPGKILSDDEIIAHVKAGKKAFGFTGQDIEIILPVIITALISQ
ncbi:DUF2620 domain-containing protein [Xenorhabdus nematophila]|uniref:DUF2620 domain-containing protein n=1 Tax=Xenorhabdus nematophila (strain ATCC 19061 / DSM 3370 / CCUG 14189 / LMG 1036 / NCIMB 9965 / AN6) TaxID=406817 RepID=D3VF26_XENNA|nr:DUF2620 domain-containing protein [Xenorhabdus nematophila]CEE90950.1 conserved hypothetical protein [Xenorhabdus nematophila str. Anatoliense]CEF29120.1 conserved hypothetical protein [Xenorhabdus nematophila str. Websteri]AYA41807.1 DUF2620 domain-containing protein [Xenorhabdus nematophila]KHD29656.1 hypothetical protein LH67_01335 [Xenorhabdus nematophila]MBA0020537.1 DUF2620 domain-containing protein [Xenorhabdus nematophila]